MGRRSGSAAARRGSEAEEMEMDLEPTLLSVQYLPPKPWSTGVRRLMVEVLKDGIEEFLWIGSGNKRGKRRKEAESWIFSNDESSLFSFSNLCAALNLEADRVRRALVALRLQTQGRFSVIPAKETVDKRAKRGH